MARQEHGLAMALQIGARRGKVRERGLRVGRAQFHDPASRVIDVDQQRAGWRPVLEPAVIAAIALDQFALAGTAIPELVDLWWPLFARHPQPGGSHQLANRFLRERHASTRAASRRPGSGRNRRSLPGSGHGLRIRDPPACALRKILKQSVRIAFCRIDLNVLQKEPNRPRNLPHPFQTPVVAPVQEIIDQRLKNPRRGQQRGDLGEDIGFVRKDLCFDANEHRSTEKAEILRTN